MQKLKSSELRLLNRLAIEPSTYQAELAKELGISRSAVNQVWTQLEQDRDLRVKSSIDYGRLGYVLIFGWAKAKLPSDILDKFRGWLQTSHNVTTIIESSLSSVMDRRVLFEAVIPQQRVISFLEQLERFKKRPYQLSVVYDKAVKRANHMNLAQFNGLEWDLQAGFRFEASIGAAQSYLDVLPINRTMQFSESQVGYPEEASIAATIERKYNISSREVAEWLESHNFSCPSGRTLRRRLVELRDSLALPYITVDEIGLTQRVVVCVEEKESEYPISRLLHAQSSTFPSARVVVGPRLTVLELMMPRDFDWLAMSSSLSILDQSASISTFLTESETTRKGLESVLISEKGRKV